MSSSEPAPTESAATTTTFGPVPSSSIRSRPTPEGSWQAESHAAAARRGTKRRRRMGRGGVARASEPDKREAPANSCPGGARPPRAGRSLAERRATAWHVTQKPRRAGGVSLRILRILAGAGRGTGAWRRLRGQLVRARERLVERQRLLDGRRGLAGEVHRLDARVGLGDGDGVGRLHADLEEALAGV